MPKLNIELRNDLVLLANGWRAKANRLKQKFPNLSPEMDAYLTVTLETCAEELEEIVRNDDQQ